MSTRIKHQGLFPHRHTANPAERRLAEAWEKLNTTSPGFLANMLDVENKGRPITQRDAHVAATVIQWLGSPIGREFITDNRP